MQDNRLDFDYAHTHIEIRGKHIDTHDIALGLSTYLISLASRDDLMEEQTYSDPHTPQFTLNDVGFALSHPTQSHQRAALASCLALYGSYRMQSLVIGICDYLCLKELKDTLDADMFRYNNLSYGRGVRDYITDTHVFLHTILSWFEQEYSKQDPEFSKQLMFEKLKQ